jgi:hypothetical protein
MNRGDKYRLRIADLPVVVRKSAKPHRCTVCVTAEIERGSLAGTIAVRKRIGPRIEYSQQYVCVRCIETRCDPDVVRRDYIEDREWKHRDTGGRLPWE